MSFDLQSHPAAVAAIDRISADALTLDRFFEAYQRPGVPVIITGLLAEPDWNLEFLTAQLGNQSFSVRCYGRDRYSQDKRQWKDIGSGTKPRQMTFTEYAAALRSGEAAAKDLYLAKCPLRSTALGKRTSFHALRD
ncbi:MAG: hypothetical protein F6K28_46980, partial [Microcoleus sp. SIO2G3]|nr:hypothetical protein [Microcoleus sp. SIO2G3]